MEPLWCRQCCILALRQREAQLKIGKSNDEIIITEPVKAITWQPEFIENGQAIVVPVCAGHLSYKEASRLTGL
jgi:hypothetical protein